MTGIAPDNILEFADVSVEFGGVKALSAVTFGVPTGQICGVIGPNGAGKTTLFNVASSLQPVTSGTIWVQGRKLPSARPHELVRRGLARTFQHVGLFTSMSVLDNIMVGAAAPWSARWPTRYLGVPPPRRIEREIRASAEAMLDLLDLGDLRAKGVNELPFGSAKRVELARALAAQPQVLLLDEPAGGLTRREVDEFGGLIATAASDLALTVVIVEHHMGLVSSLCERLVVLDHGVVVADGDVQETLKSDVVVAAYFGSRADR